MEVKGATLLYTLASLMITFAGFSALLFVVRQAAGARLSLLDRYLAKTVMTRIFVLTAAAAAASADLIEDQVDGALGPSNVRRQHDIARHSREEGHVESTRRFIPPLCQTCRLGQDVVCMALICRCEALEPRRTIDPGDAGCQ
jgi:hypothetical protein